MKYHKNKVVDCSRCCGNKSNMTKYSKSYYLKIYIISNKSEVFEVFKTVAVMRVLRTYFVKYVQKGVKL